MQDEALLAAYPREVVDHDTKHFFRGLLERRLVMNRCRDCGRWHHPPMPCCPECWSFALEAVPVSGRGTVYFGVRLHQGPVVPGVDYSQPYPVVTVELEEQAALRLTAPLVEYGGSDIPVGMPVSLTWIDRAGVPYPAFCPVEGVA